MNEKDIKDKAVFVVGLLAALLAFTAFKTELSGIKLSISGHDYSLLKIVVTFVIMLTLAVYCYALDYLRYSFGKYQNFILFRCIIPCANFFYSCAISFPLLVLVFWIVGSEPIYGFVTKYKSQVMYFDIITVSLLVLFNFYHAYFITKRSVAEKIEVLENLRSSSLQKAIKLFENGFYGESVLEAHKVLEQYLQERLLVDKNLSTRYIPMRELLKMAQENKLIEDRHIPSAKDLIQIRNVAAHLDVPITKESAKSAMETVKSILENDGPKEIRDESKDLSCK